MLHPRRFEVSDHVDIEMNRRVSEKRDRIADIHGAEQSIEELPVRDRRVRLPAEDVVVI